jgi:hypothetical protein
MGDMMGFGRSEMMESGIAAADIEKAHHESRAISHYVLPQVPGSQTARSEECETQKRYCMNEFILKELSSHLFSDFEAHFSLYAWISISTWLQLWDH